MILIYLLQIIGIAIALFLLLVRAGHGIDTTDEMWYIAEPWAVANQGLIPFVNNYTQATGFTLPLSIIYKLFSLFSPNAQGIVLLSRCLFVIWSLTILLTSGVLLKHRYFFIGLLPVLFFTPNSILVMNYNSIGTVYLPLVLALIFSAINDEKYQSLKCVIAGIVLGRICMGKPQAVVFAFSLFVIICFYRSVEYNVRIRILAYILCGVLISAFSVCIYIIANGGNIYYSLIRQLSVPYMHVKHLYGILDNTRATLMLMFPIAGLLILGIVAKSIFRNKSNEIISAFFAAYWLFSAIRFWDERDSFIQHVWFLALLHAILCDRVKERYLIICTSLCYFIGYLFSVYTNIYGYGTQREYWIVVPTLLFFYSVCDQNKGKYALGICLYIIFCIIGARWLLNENSRFGNLSEQSVKVQSGIWKGIYTTSNTKLFVEELENKIIPLVEEDETVLFMEGWVSYAYCMIRGRILSTTTYDPMMHGYGVEDDDYLLDYYELIDERPDKIVYIEYEDNEKIASDIFDEFLARNYYLYSEEELNHADGGLISVYKSK